MAVQGMLQPAQVLPVLLVPPAVEAALRTGALSALPASCPGCRMQGGKQMETVQQLDYAGALTQTSSDNLSVSILSVKENQQTPPQGREQSGCQALCPFHLLAAGLCILLLVF